MTWTNSSGSVIAADEQRIHVNQSPQLISTIRYSFTIEGQFLSVLSLSNVGKVTFAVVANFTDPSQFPNSARNGLNYEYVENFCYDRSTGRRCGPSAFLASSDSSLILIATVAILIAVVITIIVCVKRKGPQTEAQKPSFSKSAKSAQSVESNASNASGVSEASVASAQ